jgi:putative addiction module component (TIGR02574 family)
LALPVEEREMLASELLASLDPSGAKYSAEQAHAVAREIERRIERFAAGGSEGVDLAAARQQVRAASADG